MSLLPSFKRINTEDFAQEDRELVGKLASSINVFAEDVNSVLSKNIDFDNRVETVKEIVVALDGSGNPIVITKVKSDLPAACKGTQVIRVVNLDDATLFPTGTPFIAFTDNNGLLTINNITNLSTGTRWKLRVIFYP